MKKHFVILTLLLVFLLLSCSSDNDDSNNEPAGEMIINGQHYPLTKGFLIPNPTGENPDFDPRRFYFVLTNGDISFEDGQFIYNDNISQLIDFNMYTSEEHSGSVENTTYEVYNPGGQGFDFSQAFIDHSGINTDVVIQNGEYISSNNISSDDLDGQATISKNGNIYTITFSFSNEEDVISGTYTGTLAVLE